MFGVSFSELVVVAIVALVVAGPRRLPEMLGTVGQWIGRLRRMTTEMRRQTGIDEILREEGLHGGLNELRSMMRGDLSVPSRLAPPVRGVPPPGNPGAAMDAYGEPVDFDRLRELPVEGPDACGAVPEDLLVGAPEEPRPLPAPGATEPS